MLGHRCPAGGLDLRHRLLRTIPVDVGAHDAAPSSAKRSAEARPTPEPAPVIDCRLVLRATPSVTPPSRSTSSITALEQRPADAARRPRIGITVRIDAKLTAPFSARRDTGGSAGVKRYSLSALPRRSLYWTSGDRCPMQLLDRADAVRPGRVRVRVVRLAHDVVLADLVDTGDPVVVVDEAAEDVVAEQLPDVDRVQVHVRRWRGP